MFWTHDDQHLSVADAFTTLSIVALVSGPLVNIIAAYPTLVGGLACFERIQTFLKADEMDDYRRDPEFDGVEPSLQITSFGTREAIEVEDSGETRAVTSPRDASLALHIYDASFSLKTGDDIVLQSISLRIPRSSLTIMAGPVGAGKSTLLKGILGEAHLEKGSVQLSSGSVAYCDQTPWLRLGSIRRNILGPNEFNERWFSEVIRACALDQDLVQLDDGDHSLVGSAGIALSGGQKQRVALARAVYARAALVLLDDVFSGLDQATSDLVFERLLGEGGLLRTGDTTILLATHAVRYLSNADSVITVERGTARQYSSYGDFCSSKSYTELSISQDNGHLGTPSESLKHTPAVQGSQDKTATADASTNDLTRKTGDLSLYKFYLDSVGLTIFLSWLLLAGCYIFSGKIPREYLIHRNHLLLET